MKKCLQTSFLNHHLIHRLSFVCFCLAGMLVSLIGVPSASAASSAFTPLVVVAVDTTPSTCTITRTVRNHSGVLVTPTNCPAGTSVSTTNVPLSQARAQHETYVMYPASPQQARELIQAKMQAFQSAQNTVVRPAVCDGGGSEEVDLFANYHGDVIDMFVYYDGASDCSNLFLEEEAIGGSSPVPYGDYWVASYYNGHAYNGWCQPAAQNNKNDFIGTRNLTIYPNGTYLSSKYNEWDIATNSCSSSSNAITPYQVLLTV